MLGFLQEANLEIARLVYLPVILKKQQHSIGERKVPQGTITTKHQWCESFALALKFKVSKLTNVVRDALVHLLHHLLETVLLATSHCNKLGLITTCLQQPAAAQPQNTGTKIIKNCTLAAANLLLIELINTIQGGRVCGHV